MATATKRRGRPRKVLPANTEVFNLWMPKGLKNALRNLAESNRRTLAAEVILAVERACRDAGIPTNQEDPS